ncbi:MAG: hypothetical protein EAZ55_12180 [Cytophagales bacterium]|nr:MAG: hypothetical protein EAZ55_12180 [Cytophagales bacterium]
MHTQLYRKYLHILFVFFSFVTTALGQVPTISSFSTTSGAAGSSVTITGNNFNTTLANNVVWFGGVRATVTAASATSLTVTVPVGLESETVVRILNTATKLIGESKQVFNLTFPVKALATSNYAAIVNFAGLANNSSDGIAVGDLDGDGKTEVVVATDGGSGTGSLILYRNTATPGIINASSFNTNVSLSTRRISGVRMADFNGDGKLDIVVSMQVPEEIGILENQSTGVGNFSFGTIVVIALPAGGANRVNDVEVADIDGDGKIDIVSSNQIGSASQMISVFRNVYTSGAILTTSFTRTDLTGVFSQPQQIDVGDIDNDGKPDIVASTNQGTINIFENNSTSGTISFSAFASRNVTAGVSRSIAIADFDGDGLNDIAISTTTTLNIDIFINTNTVPGTLSFPTSPALTITGLAGM